MSSGAPKANPFTHAQLVRMYDAIDASKLDVDVVMDVRNMGNDMEDNTERKIGNGLPWSYIYRISGLEGDLTLAQVKEKYKNYKRRYGICSRAGYERWRRTGCSGPQTPMGTQTLSTKVPSRTSLDFVTPAITPPATPTAIPDRNVRNSNLNGLQSPGPSSLSPTIPRRSEVARGVDSAGMGIRGAVPASAAAKFVVGQGNKQDALFMTPKVAMVAMPGRMPNIPSNTVNCTGQVVSSGLRRMRSTRNLEDMEWRAILATDSVLHPLVDMKPKDWALLINDLKISTTKSGVQIMKEFYSQVAPFIRADRFMPEGGNVKLELTPDNFRAMITIYHAIKKTPTRPEIRNVIDCLLNSRVLFREIEDASGYWRKLFAKKLLMETSAYFFAPVEDFLAVKMTVFNDVIKDI